MGLSLKQKISLLDNATGTLDEMVQDANQLLPWKDRHVIDRLNGVVTDMKDIVECLRQNGVIDEELVGILAPEVLGH